MYFIGELLIFNHFENNKEICTKSGLIDSLSKYYKSNWYAYASGYGVFDSMATSFKIKISNVKSCLQRFRGRYIELANKKYENENMPEKHCTENIWVLKPENMNNGRGIKISKDLKEIETFIL